MFGNIPVESWLKSPYINNFNKFNLKDEIESIYFEFQDIRNGNVSSSKGYTLWKYADVYKDYIDEINYNLNELNNSNDKNDKM